MNFEMHSFVEEQAAGLSHGDIAELGFRLPTLRQRFCCLDRRDCPNLAAQYEFLALIVEDGCNHLRCEVPEACHRESAFALLYLEKRGYLWPDDAPGLGLTDNQAMVAIVLHKYRQALRACPRGYLFQWESAPVDLDRMILERLHQRITSCRHRSLGTLWREESREKPMRDFGLRD